MFRDESTDTWNVFCDNGLCPVEPGTAICFSEHEAVEAWNTRAERTCKNVDEYASAGFFICGECGFGENGLEMVTTYCPQCGARVEG